MNRLNLPTHNIEIALYMPEIAQNVGTIIRTCAAFQTALHIIHPCGFAWDSKLLSRSAMDYIDLAKVTHHNTWEDFQQEISKEKYTLIGAVCSENAQPFYKYKYDNNETKQILLFGQESKGLPVNIEKTLDELIIIPMHESARSLNLAISVGIILSYGIFKDMK